MGRTPPAANCELDRKVVAMQDQVDWGDRLLLEWQHLVGISAVFRFDPNLLGFNVILI